MRWLKLITKILLALILVVGLLFAVLTIYGWENVWDRTAGSPDLGPVAFDDLAKTPNPNQALVCPPDLCTDDDVDIVSPVYALPPARLQEELLNNLRREDDLIRVDDGTAPLHMRFVQRSRWFRFPDTVRVRIIPLADDRSTLAIYSQSQIGQGDFGVNLERVQRWLSFIDAFEAQD